MTLLFQRYKKIGLPVLVIGGEGLLGSHIVRALRDAAGQPVVAITRRTNPPALPGVHWHTVDLCHSASVQSLADVGAAAIVHAAAVLPRSLDDAEAAEANLKMDTHVLKLAERTHASLIYLSSQSVYEHEPSPWCETQQVLPTSAYAASKHYIEQALRALPAASAALRISSPYSAFDSSRPGVLFHFVREAVAGRPLTVMGNGERTQDFVHGIDVARAVSAVLRAWSDQPDPNRHDVFNIASGKAISMNQLAEQVLSCCGSGRIEHAGDDDDGDHRSGLSIAHAVTSLGWQPDIGLESGIGQLVRRLRGSNEDWLAI
jgi:nucleoside-diphosphate-sugar epimerase